MRLFRHKKKQECDHNYKEIGRWYFEEGYANQDCIHACIVYECEICGKRYNIGFINRLFQITTRQTM